LAGRRLRQRRPSDEEMRGMLEASADSEPQPVPLRYSMGQFSPVAPTGGRGPARPPGHRRMRSYEPNLKSFPPPREESPKED
jgi:hypothetical protein